MYYGTANALSAVLTSLDLGDTQEHLQNCLNDNKRTFIFDCDQGDDLTIGYAISEILKHWPIDFICQPNNWSEIREIMEIVIEYDCRAIFFGFNDPSINYMPPHFCHAVNGEERILGITQSMWQKHSIICNPYRALPPV